MKLRLKDLREDADLSQKDIATVLNVRQNTYSQYETGTRQIPIDCLIKLALYYNTSVDYIITFTDDPLPHPLSKYFTDLLSSTKSEAY